MMDNFKKFEYFLSKNKKSLLILGGVVLTGILLHKYWKKKQDDDSKSEFIGSPFGQTVQFTLTNDSNSAQTAILFDSFNLKNNNRVNISPDISFFNRNLIVEPIKIKDIQLRNISGNNNLDSPILIRTLDANGEESDTYLNPMISPYQTQGNIVTVQPDNLILSGKTTLGINVNPNSAISLVITYDIVESRTKELENKNSKS